MATLNPALLELIVEARAAGLRLEIEGALLSLVGPRTAKDIALRLLDHKPEVLALLTPCYSAPWPEVLPNLTRRRVDSSTFCAGPSGDGQCPGEQLTFVRYGDVPTCQPCAMRQIAQARVGTPAPVTSKVPA